MDAESINTPPEDQMPVERISAVSRVFKMFYEPTSVFKTLNRKLDWLLPLLIIVVVGSGVDYFTRPIMNRDMRPIFERSLEKYRQYMTETEYKDTLKKIDEPFKWYSPFVYLVILAIIMLLLAVISLLTGNFIFGGKCSFWIILGVVGYAGLIGLLGDLIKGIMIFAKDDWFVYTGLGLLKPANDGSFLYYLLKMIDVFAIWRLIVLSVGLSIVYKMKPFKFASVIFILWIILVLLVALGDSTITMGWLSQLFS